ncbi:MAG: carboxylate--amine ligase [Candidatus Gracilibacteria bacterium]|jgi:glutamate--cysteine ligase
MNIRQKIENEVFVKGYKDMDFSAQMIIREALKRKIKVEVLDRKNNFIRLIKGKKIEYLYDANYTSLDSQICTFLMENKFVSKIVLSEHGLKVADGGIYYSEESALRDFEKKYKKLDLIVKPNTTNFGIGINFVSKGNKAEFINAIKYSFKFDSSILVEEFIKGEEYRFLVLGGKLEAIVFRRPANVTGDGIHTIKELIKIKNDDLSNYKKITRDEILASEVEKNYLKTQGLSFSSIPKKGQIIFVRKNSNVATGGDAIDVTDDLHFGYKKIAEKAAKSVGAKICGVDIMIQDIKAKPTPKNYCIIELNPNPGLTIHRFVWGGKVRPVEKKTLDLLGF